MLCKNVCQSVAVIPLLPFMFVVQRVHWLRARAQKHRWEEEVVLVGHEMEWTVRYFLYNKKLWNGQKGCQGGAGAYAARAAAMWHAMAKQAEDKFTSVNISYCRLLPA